MLEDAVLVVGAEPEEEAVVAGVGVGLPSSAFSRYNAGRSVR